MWVGCLFALDLRVYDYSIRIHGKEGEVNGLLLFAVPVCILQTIAHMLATVVLLVVQGCEIPVT